MVSQKLISNVYENNLEGAWKSFTVRVGKRRVVNFGRVETDNVAALRSLVGDSGFIAIRVNNHEVIRKFNPERKGLYQFMMPEYVGELKPGERIMIWVRPVSKTEFIEKAVESLPFGLKLKLEDESRGILSFMDAISIPVRVVRFEWSEGNNALEIDLEFNGNGEKHILAVAVKGDEKKATIRFRRTSGTIHSIRLGTVPSQIVVRYHDFKGRYFDHGIILNSVALTQMVEWAGRLELGEEIYEIRRLVGSNQTIFGNKMRDKVVDMVLRTGRIAGRRINPNKYKTEVPIGNRNEKVDAIFESDEGRLIVLEVKSTADPGNVGEQYERAWKRLKGDSRNGKLGYMQLIKEYGLSLWDRIRDDVDAYIIALVKVNLERGLCDVEVQEVPKD
ncbi:MAG: hypothetical protein QXP45_02155 [Thermoproteota archaeon]